MGLLSLLMHTVRAVRVEGAQGVELAARGAVTRDCPRGADACGVCGGDGSSCCGPAGACSSHGTCAGADQGCLCDVGFTGRFCQRTQDLCAHTGCGEHGRCMRDSGQCACRPGWFGSQCEMPTCSYHGIYDKRTLSCRCVKGWAGDACNECATPADESKAFVCMGMASLNGTTPAPVGLRHYRMRTIPQDELELYLGGGYGQRAPGAPKPEAPNTYLDDDEEWLLDCGCNVVHQPASAAGQPSYLTDGNAPNPNMHLRTEGTSDEDCQAFLQKLSDKNDFVFDPADTDAEGISYLADVLTDRRNPITIVLSSVAITAGAAGPSLLLPLFFYKILLGQDLLLQVASTGVGRVASTLGK